MTRTESLRTLESLLESFLQRLVALKAERLAVLTGINRLDDIARNLREIPEPTEAVGDWFARYQAWLNEQVLRPSDRRRIGLILDRIRKELHLEERRSPAAEKIATEIERWRRTMPLTPPGGRRVVLRRPPEPAVRHTADDEDSDIISRFDEHLQRLLALYRDMAGGRAHLISVLDEALTSAAKQKNTQALHLAATLIYYLRRNGDLVGPFVKRLKEAEAMLQEESPHA